MDNNQLKIISFTLLVLVIIFSVGTIMVAPEFNSTNDNVELESKTVTQGTVSLTIREPKTTQTGKVKINIIKGDTI